jgi:hypothetical protein
VARRALAKAAPPSPRSAAACVHMLHSFPSRYTSDAQERAHDTRCRKGGEHKAELDKWKWYESRLRRTIVMQHMSADWLGGVRR